MTTDLAIVNARVFTGDPRRPWADALLLAGGRIAALGSSAEVKKRAGPATRVIDARGMLVLPGVHADDAPAMAAAHAAVSRRPAGGDDAPMLRAGGAATLTLVEPDLSRLPAGRAGEARVVLAMDAGRIVHER